MVEKAKIVIGEMVAETGIKKLQNLGYLVCYDPVMPKDIFLDEVRDATAIIVRRYKVDENVLDIAKNLKVVAKHGAGYENIDLEAAKKRGIRLVFTPGANANSVAEYTIALLLDLVKKTSQMREEYKKGNYDFKDQCRRIDLRNKSIGLLGAGHIGSIVAKICAFGFGMKVQIFDPYLPEDRQIKAPNIQYIRDKDSVIASADFLSLHLPSNQETRGSIDATFFSKMKPGSYLLNVSRGDLIVEEDLVKAIQSGHIAGAGLDVSNPEPAKQDNPLFALEEVVLTPHCAAGTVDAMENMILAAVEGIDDILHGRIPKHEL
ncbi:MAG: hydroxyacid dehydrogenase [Peptoniphilaceae bacterium]|nr:hydroxyacid dehydrogenase [Peptoniphilaceae bacterium]MDD7434169.1 hydroxyacid dehydrogenase [Peptoniphilaceae bacterium]MDY3075265.1 hydroxyacid dehydrogenase [Peptoniphilaceae bacterium]